MTSPLHATDLLHAQRYADGQMPPAEAADFAARLETEPALREAVAATRQVSALFAATANPAPPALRPDFAARVLAGVRHLPTRAELFAEVPELGELDREQREVAGLARRLLVAAALIFALGLLMFAGLSRRSDSGRLEASPVDRQKIDQLDAKIRRSLAEPTSTEPRTR